MKTKSCYSSYQNHWHSEPFGTINGEVARIATMDVGKILNHGTSTTRCYVLNREHLGNQESISLDDLGDLK